ncbi:TetR family transcriptional regulator [Microbacterium sp.]|uniref:acyl-CoA-like ligand-binding transcription factor n=1 Tax=Microbacterium sp. TaxID=51671 RepID=UPI0039E41597
MSDTRSLRERLREQTSRQIHTAVRELSAEIGFDRVTVDLISTRAGISPRTFFNYFPSKESALLDSPPVQLRGEHAIRFAEGPVSGPSDVLVELTRTLLDQLAEEPPDRAGARTIFQIATEHPTVFAALVAQLDTVRLELSRAVAQRLGSDADPQLPDLVASVAMASVRSGLEAWVAGEGDSPVPYVRHAVELMQTLTSPR